MENSSIRTVFLGIDVHKRTYSVTAVMDSAIVKRASMAADSNVLLAFIHKFFSNCKIYSVYEAGFSGYSLHRFLLDNGINSIVVHPGSIEVEARNRSKTDKRDSQKMAKQLSEGKLHCVNVPSIKREAWRTLTRLRLQYVKERTRLSSKIKALLFYFGLIHCNHKSRTSRKWIKQFLTFKHETVELVFSLQSYAETWLHLDEKIKKIDIQIKEQAKKDFKIDDVYRRNYGIGLISARILANELDDLSQFNSSRQLYSFIGLTPSEYSSGDKKRYGNITRQGNPIIRSILTEAAWKAIERDPEWEALFDRLVRNTGSRKKAILGVARRMMGRIRAEFKKGEEYVRDLHAKEVLCIR